MPQGKIGSLERSVSGVRVVDIRESCLKLEDAGFMYRDPVEYRPSVSAVGQAITVGALPALKDLPLRRWSSYTSAASKSCIMGSWLTEVFRNARHGTSPLERPLEPFIKEWSYWIYLCKHVHHKRWQTPFLVGLSKSLSKLQNLWILQRHLVDWTKPSSLGWSISSRSNLLSMAEKLHMAKSCCV